MSFGETLQKLRKQKGWSQEELAEKLELTRQTISKWELEQSTPDLDYIIALSDLFQVSADCLIRGEEKQETAPAEKTESAPPQNEAKLIMIWVIIGSVLLVPGLGGIITFMVLATVDAPATAEINGYVFKGFLGYLICHHAVFYFVICVLLLLGGVALYALGLVKYYGQKKKNAPTK